ncbi:hypothetical protein [Streptomyces sp. NPDC059874]|uniref:hypothetical protein n=1 Tax=Streptomyces sp. NPDC059874 TaxID=3346983 RepID=UPI0036595AC4
MNPNTSRLLRTARLAAPALGALTLTVALAGPAAADPSFASRSGGEVRFAALPGEQNTVKISDNGGFLEINDSTSRITPGPGCVPVDLNTVRCGTVAGTTRIQASLGDRNDVFDNTLLGPVPNDVDGGAGDDKIYGGFGTDRLTDPDGWNSPIPIGTVTFDGRGGNDTIVSRNGGYDRVQCGGGAFDLVVADAATLDNIQAGCEFVVRS